MFNLKTELRIRSNGRQGSQQLLTTTSLLVWPGPDACHDRGLRLLSHDDCKQLVNAARYCGASSTVALSDCKALPACALAEFSMPAAWVLLGHHSVSLTFELQSCCRYGRSLESLSVGLRQPGGPGPRADQGRRCTMNGHGHGSWSFTVTVRSSCAAADWD